MPTKKKEKKESATKTIGTIPYTVNEEMVEKANPGHTTLVKLDEWRRAELKARQSLAGEMAETMLAIVEPILDEPRDPLDTSPGRATNNAAFVYMMEWPTGSAINNVEYKLDYMNKCEAAVERSHRENAGDSNGIDLDSYENVAALKSSDQWMAAKLIADAYNEVWERVMGQCFDIDQFNAKKADNKRSKSQSKTPAQKRASAIFG